MYNSVILFIVLLEGWWIIILNYELIIIKNIVQLELNGIF